MSLKISHIVVTTALKKIYIYIYIYYWQKVFAAVAEEEMINSFIDIIRYATQYFNNEDVNPVSHMNIVETNIRSKLLPKSLN